MNKRNDYRVLGESFVWVAGVKVEVVGELLIRCTEEEWNRIQDVLSWERKVRGFEGNTIEELIKKD